MGLDNLSFFHFIWCVGYTSLGGEQNRTQHSDVALANIEAMASGEGEGGGKSIMTCPNDKEITCSGAERCVTDVQEMYIECDGTRYCCPR